VNLVNLRSNTKWEGNGIEKDIPAHLYRVELTLAVTAATILADAAVIPPFPK